MTRSGASKEYQMKQCEFAVFSLVLPQVPPAAHARVFNVHLRTIKRWMEKLKLQYSTITRKPPLNATARLIRLHYATFVRSGHLRKYEFIFSDETTILHDYLSKAMHDQGASPGYTQAPSLKVQGKTMVWASWTRLGGLGKGVIINGTHDTCTYLREYVSVPYATPNSKPSVPVLICKLFSVCSLMF